MDVEQSWQKVMEHWAHINRRSHFLCRCDPRLVVNEFRSVLVEDLVRNRMLWDPSRPYKGWVTSRAWGCRTSMLYTLNRHERGVPTMRRRWTVEGPEGEELNPLDVAFVQDGAWGHESRADARAVLTELYRRASPRGRSLLLAELQGLKPQLVRCNSRREVISKIRHHLGFRA